jgi:hypothetical protein
MYEIKLYDETKVDISETKFIQRMIFKNKIENKVCDWIMRDFKNYTKDNKEWENNVFITDNNSNNKIFFLEKIKSIFPFILDLFDSIINDIMKCYYLNNAYIYKINEIFIEKYNEPYSKLQSTYQYKSNTIVVNILLTNNSNINNKLIYFSDAIVSYMEIGDMIIFSANTEHYKMKDTTDEMYILVGLITVYRNDTIITPTGKKNETKI